jgi:hypothetical protein
MRRIATHLITAVMLSYAQAPFFAAPVTLGRQGVEKIHPLGPLSAMEQVLSSHAAGHSGRTSLPGLVLRSALVLLLVTSLSQNMVKRAVPDLIKQVFDLGAHCTGLPDRPNPMIASVYEPP